MSNEHDHNLKPAATDEATESRVQELRVELEQAGRWGIVTWTDDDIINALESAGANSTPQNVQAVREHFSVRHIDDEMTVTGWRVIEEAISGLGLVPPRLVRLAKKASEADALT